MTVLSIFKLNFHFQFYAELTLTVEPTNEETMHFLNIWDIYIYVYRERESGNFTSQRGEFNFINYAAVKYHIYKQCSEPHFKIADPDPKGWEK